MIKERKGNEALRICDECGHEQWVNYWNLYRKDIHLCRYCNNNKQGKNRIGKYQSWNKGKKFEPKQVGSYYINNNGYVEAWVGKHTLTNKVGGYYREHRLISELKLGRSLSDKEIVHHIDANKINNTESNLFVCKDDKHHQNVHSQLERVSMELVRDGVIKFNHETGQYYIDPNIRESIRKSLELLETPEKDNQQRSFIHMTDEERSTTIQKWSRLKQAEAGDNSLS